MGREAQGAGMRPAHRQTAFTDQVDNLSTRFSRDAKPFTFVVEGDGMAPTLRPHRDVALVLPVDRYQYEGVYLLDNGIGWELFRAQPWGGGKLRLSRDNPTY
jgi:hypothetical protein